MNAEKLFKERIKSKVFSMRESALLFLDNEKSKIEERIVYSDDIKKEELEKEILAVNHVRRLVEECNYEFEGCNTVTDMMASFPTILLPAPEFVSAIRKR